MNRRMVIYILGQMLNAEALLLLLPTVVSLLYRETDIAVSFLLTILAALAAGFLCTFRKPTDRVIYAREGFAVVALSWLVLSIFGALPFWISGEIPSYIDCFFETVSGFTTTGASILTEVESLSRGILFWRSFTHWVGGMGVLVFVMTVIPLGDSRSMHIMRAEVPGPIVGKLVPRLKSTAKILYGIYILLTAIEVVLLLFGGMDLYDSLVHSFGTAGTGGFSVKNASIGAYQSPYIEWVVGTFMVLFGINFNLYFFLLLGKLRSVLQSEELRCYLGIILASTLIIAANIFSIYREVGTSLRHAFFQVSSIITTTGYATADFNEWPQLSRTILVMLMFFGACAGSTGGGLKTSRLLLYFRSMRRDLKRMLHPHSVEAIMLDGKPVSEETLNGANSFFLMYSTIACFCVLLLSIDGFDFETNFTAMAACLNNIGPGLGMVGPTGNFSAFSDFSKILLSFAMLFGRLEVFPMLLIFAPSVWRRR
ncbi:MAG: potassium transporter KefA [Oscillospiraceae bacterium]|nr:MAG: potassium transporter KefA [Oscillospiraceae bacterium]